jgi:hypothetical protein
LLPPLLPVILAVNAVRRFGDFRFDRTARLSAKITRPAASKATDARSGTLKVALLKVFAVVPHPLPAVLPKLARQRV